MATETLTVEPFVTPTRVAEVFPVSEGTLANWRSQGGGPPFLKVGGRVGYRLSDVEAWLVEHTAQTRTGRRHAG